MMNSPELSVPLYHGTSTLFLDGILAHGLGAANPISDLRLLDFITDIRPLLDAHLASTTIYQARSGSFALMAAQASRGLNFQHGHSYLSPSPETAIRYAANKRYGSELLTYTLDFLQALLDHEVPTVADQLFSRYPSIFACLDISPAPVLIRAERVPVQSLLTENGQSPDEHVKRISELCRTFPDHFDVLTQQLNFRLVQPLLPQQTKAWLINVTKWHPLKPSYTLYQLVPNATERDAS
jgi:hypothetical protein